jgi:hypothetical protein
MVLLPMTTKASDSASVTVSTADVPLRVTDGVTEMDDVMVLPLLSVVVTAVWDEGVLDGDAEVPVADSDSEAGSEVVASVEASEDCCEDCSEDDGAADVGVVSSPVVVGSSVVLAVVCDVGSLVGAAEVGVSDG